MAARSRRHDPLCCAPLPAVNSPVARAKNRGDWTTATHDGELRPVMNTLTHRLIDPVGKPSTTAGPRAPSLDPGSDEYAGGLGR